MNLSPRVMFGYNRPWHTQQTIEALQKNELASESELFIYADNAKRNKTNDEVLKVRRYIKKIDGFKKVTIIEREKNFGLADSVIEGVTQVVNKYGRVIVMEDDLLVSPYFLAYMNSSLCKYADKVNVMQISGYMFDVKVNCREDAFFLPFCTSWGWATWNERWQLFDASSKGYTKLRNNKKDIQRFNLNNNYPYFKMLKAQMAGRINSWAIRWYLSVFENKGVVLYPYKTLVYNLGFDGSGEHCAENNLAQSSILESKISIFPDSIIVIEEHERAVFNCLGKANYISLIGRLKLMIKNIFSTFKKCNEK